MVTSNKLPDKKVVKMGEHNNSAVVPQRTLIGEVNEHIMCPLCRGYYIDATTIVECLHSFCRSCIIKHLKAKSYCPVCEMMINSAKPNIKPDKALQDIVYKLVPGLFQKEMERRQQFYSSRPGPAASATPEQRGEDTERIIFSPEDVISFSLEYADATDADSISSKSSDSNEPLSNNPASTRRYLQCPAVVNISHLKKFLSMKFDIDSTQYAIDILYKRVPLPDYYTLMDIAYIYNWKRNEPMRFFYQIIDYVAIRNRIFDINRKSSFRGNKSSPALTEDTNDSSPAPNINDQASEASSGTASPMPDESNKQLMKKDKVESGKAFEVPADKNNPSKKNDEEEKSQFLISFELTAKNSGSKNSPSKSSTESQSTESTTKPSSAKTEEKTDTLKRKHSSPPNMSELKKLKIEIEKAKIGNLGSPPSSTGSSLTSGSIQKSTESPMKPKTPESSKVPSSVPNLTAVSTFASTSANNPIPYKELKVQLTSTTLPTQDNATVKRPVMTPQTAPKRKHPNDAPSNSPAGKVISPLKIQVPKLDSPITVSKHPEQQKGPTKKIPDLKPSVPGSQPLPKTPVNKVRMDLLANNSDPTIDRSKIMSQVKSSLGGQSPSSSGDPLKSLFDSCKINIPSSLSITLTDQKLDPRAPVETSPSDPKKGVVNKNLAGASSGLPHKVPSPPVHNYIEIRKLPDTDGKKPTKTDNATETKTNPQNKTDNTSGPPKSTKSSETSAKGPIPNLKPIADTKLGKQNAANFASAAAAAAAAATAATAGSGPITFQQTFEQQLQTLQTDKKSKTPKTKAQLPKLVPATPKSFSAANKPNPLINKPAETKTGAALDLSSPHPVTPQGGAQQTFDKAFETMQSIANLAKKQSLSAKGMSPSLSQSTSFTGMSNRPVSAGASPLRIPSAGSINQIKLDKILPASTVNIPRSESINKSNSGKPGSSSSPTTSPGYQMSPHPPLSSAQPSPRQTRSPSSSPKLVIAEEKQGTMTEQNLNQSNQISSTQISSGNAPKSDSPSAVPGPSKLGMKPLKPLTPSGKIPGRQPISQSLKSNQPSMSIPQDYIRPQLMQHALLRQQMEMNAAWLKATQRQYEFDRFKNMANMSHQNPSDFNKDKQ